MKKILVYTILIAATLVLAASTSCVSSQSPIPVRGSGELTNKTYDVTNFNSIEVSSGFDVNLEQGSNEQVILTAQENLFEYIVVKVEDGILKIYMERNVIQTKQLKAKIFLKSIASLKVSGGGDVFTENILDVPKLDIRLSGGGDLKSALKTSALNCNISGGGDADIKGEVGDFQLDISGGGDIMTDVAANSYSCNVSGGGDFTLNGKKQATNATFSISGGGDIHLTLEADVLRCSVSGGGDAELTGKAQTLDIAVNGGGNVNAGNFVAENASFKANGGSDIYVNATAQINGNISGGGDVYYSGNPQVVNIDAKGGSEVHKK